MPRQPGMLRKGLLILLLAVCFINMAATVTVAVEDIGQVQHELDKGTTDKPQKNIIWWEFVKLVFFLVLLIGLAGLVIRFLGKNTTTRSQGQFMRIVDEVVLGPNRGIALCEVGGRLYGLGITEHNITLLFETDNPELLEGIDREALLSNQSRPGPLARILKQAIPVGSQSGHFSVLMSEQMRRWQDMVARDGEKEAEMGKNDHYE